MEYEVWRIVPSVPTHMASNQGRVMQIPFVGKMPYGGDKHYGGQPTYGNPGDAGRLQINVKGKVYRVHLMVCEAFNGPRPSPKHVCMHMDENNQNNKSSNLVWGTQKENLNAPGFIEYRKRSGPKTTLDEDKARHIKYGSGSCADMGRLYGISPATVSNIRAGRSWKHI